MNTRSAKSTEMENIVAVTKNTDPWLNLAAEELLFRTAEHARVLFLWQNENTVVIGRNQNAWAECRCELLEREGGRLARRKTGGGAVFHDLGNINFSFVMPKDEYDLAKQSGVIISALARFGLRAEFTGRNDLTVDGMKFSGNAFLGRRGVMLQHGTLLVSSDFGRLGRYLTPSLAKLEGKGVRSVRSRVVNLSDLNGAVTVPALTGALLEAFCEMYGEYRALPDFVSHESPELRTLYCEYSNWNFRMGRSPLFDTVFEHRFDWGGLSLHLCTENGYVREAAAYSDAMDADAVEALGRALTGCRFVFADLAEAVRPVCPYGSDVAAWLYEMI